MPKPTCTIDDDAVMEAAELAQISRLLLLRDGLLHSNLRSLADAADPAHSPSTRRELQAAVLAALGRLRRAETAWRVDFEARSDPYADDPASDALFDARKAAEVAMETTAKQYVAGVVDESPDGPVFDTNVLRAFVEAVTWSKPVSMPPGPATPITDEALAQRLDNVASTARSLVADPLLAGALSPRQAALMAMCADDLGRLLDDVRIWAEVTAQELRAECDESVA